MKIREAKKSDYQELLRLYNVFLETDKYLKHGQDAFGKVLKDPKSFVCVAEERKKLVGLITFRARYVVRHPWPIGQIEELFVLKEFRNKGVGRKLIKEIEKQAKKFKCRQIYVESGYQHRPAHKFYQNLDYKKSGCYFLKRRLK